MKKDEYSFLELFGNIDDEYIVQALQPWKRQTAGAEADDFSLLDSAPDTTFSKLLRSVHTSFSIDPNLPSEPLRHHIVKAPSATHSMTDHFIKKICRVFNRLGCRGSLTGLAVSRSVSRRYNRIRLSAAHRNAFESAKLQRNLSLIMVQDRIATSVTLSG